MNPRIGSRDKASVLIIQSGTMMMRRMMPSGQVPQVSGKPCFLPPLRSVIGDRADKIATGCESGALEAPIVRVWGAGLKGRLH